MRAYSLLPTGSCLDLRCLLRSDDSTSTNASQTQFTPRAQWVLQLSGSADSGRRPLRLLFFRCSGAMAKLILVALAFCGLWISKLSCDFVPARMCTQSRSEAPRSQGESAAHVSIGPFGSSLAILGMASVASARTSRSRRVVALRAEAETEAKAEDGTVAIALRPKELRKPFHM